MGTDTELAPRDPGLQPERTAMAWSRTGLAMAANAVLAIRAGLVNDDALVLSLGAVLLGVAGIFVPLGAWRKQRLLMPQVPVAPRPPLLLAVCGFALLACVTAVVATLPHLAVMSR